MTGFQQFIPKSLVPLFAKEMYWEFRAGRKITLSMLASYLSGSTIDIDGIKIGLHRGLSFPLVKAIITHRYEESERKLLAQASLHANDIVVELGTGLGYLASICARAIGSDRVFTYEANPQLEPLIRNTFKLNEVSPNLRICLCGKERGVANFYTARHFTSSSTIKTDEHIGVVQVDVIPLQEELDRIKPTVFIADIEGGEYELFRDFSFATCRMIMLEVHPDVLG